MAAFSFGVELTDVALGGMNRESRSLERPDS
jgi:hypothetical protein